MTTLKPPPFAARLLERLVPGQDHEALLGDLTEECQRRGSVPWYCRQILAAIIVGSLKDIRAHTLVAARAIVTGLISQLLLVVVTLQLKNVLTGAGVTWGDRWIGLPWYWHWPYAFWSFALIVQAIMFAGYVMIGWLIVRLHRGHGVTMVLTYCVVLWALRFAALAQFAPLTSPHPHIPSLWVPVVNGLIGESLFLIVGGYIATRPSRVA
jgi:hypothetical protein